MALKYEIIINYIKEKISDGSLKPGMKIPSIRDLSKTFLCNKATVVHAYGELEKQGTIFSIPGSGYKISDMISTIKSEDTNKNYIDLCWGSTVPLDKFVNDFGDLYKFLSINNKEILGYGDAQGLLSLRKSISENLYNNKINPNNICITSGAQQSLVILSQMDIGMGKIIVLEQPTYNIFVELMDLLKIKCRGVLRDYDGLDLKTLEEIFKTEKTNFFFTVPNFSNPLGLSYTKKEREDILELAIKYNVYIVEDDYLGCFNENFYDNTFLSLNKSNVIHIKSFSKEFLPGLRLAVTILPDNLIEYFTKLKICNDLNSNLPSQYLLNNFLMKYNYNDYIFLGTETYKKRMSLLTSNIISQLPDKTEFNPIKKGLFTSIKLEKEIICEKFIEELKDHGLLVKGNSPFYLKDFDGPNFIRLSICRNPEKNIVKGVNILAKVIRQFNKISYESSDNNLNL